MAENEEKMGKQALRRSRTVSFLRPLLETSTRSEDNTMEERRNKRSESISSQRASRPPSLSYSRTNSDLSMISQPQATGLSRLSSGLSMVSQWSSSGSAENSHPESIAIRTSSEKPRTPESGKISIDTAASCSCDCHYDMAQATPPPQSTAPFYTDSSTQTDPPLPPLQQASSLQKSSLTINTTLSAYQSSHGSLTASHGVQTPLSEVTAFQPNPVFMGRMMDYFSKPGYQLGDSLSTGYHEYQPVSSQYMYTYQEEFGAEALR